MNLVRAGMLLAIIHMLTHGLGYELYVAAWCWFGVHLVVSAVKLLE